MNRSTLLPALLFAAWGSSALGADAVCEFEDSSHRLISGNNPKDFECISARAAAGDEHWQYYFGLIRIGQVQGPSDISEGLTVLKKVALRNNKYSADAMRFIGYLYKRPDTPFQNYELAYQWLYLASQTLRFKGTAVLLPDQMLSATITPQRRKELERSAKSLLQNR